MSMPFLVVTSINGPNDIMKFLADGCYAAGWNFTIIGDKKSPNNFYLEHANFLSLKEQEDLNFSFVKKCPVGHYARKNIGYLLAFESKAPYIVETDDDNAPKNDFFTPRELESACRIVNKHGWCNIYAYFTNINIWPRGYPLDLLQLPEKDYETLSKGRIRCPIQQGLADENPDVDAIYRLVLPLPVVFDNNKSIALMPGSFCPFNSQNTTWWPEVYPLLYLPSYCSFRMTDIWRSFVAQCITSVNGVSILFTSPSVYQCRNEHDLMKDFHDELPGYLQNKKIIELFSRLDLRAGIHNIPTNMLRCYDSLVNAGIIDLKEMSLLESWLDDCSRLC